MEDYFPDLESVPDSTRRLSFFGLSAQEMLRYGNHRLECTLFLQDIVKWEQAREARWKARYPG
jgi:hypothetical protein